jgi:hypothetical protein
MKPFALQPQIKELGCEVQWFTIEDNNKSKYNYQYIL